MIRASLPKERKANAIPNSLVLDISGMRLDSALTVRDIVLPSGVRTDADPDEVVVQGLTTSAGLSSGVAEASDAAADEGGDSSDAG